MAAQFRTLLAGRRVLLLLDNARDADQVRPLLPGAGGCVAVVTSRTPLASLAAAEGAHLVALDLLDPAEARDVLHGDWAPSAWRGRRRPARRSSPPVRGCRSRSQSSPDARPPAVPSLSVSSPPSYARPPASSTRLRGEDETTDVRTVISCSYGALSARASRMFRLLGLHPGPDLTAAAAASLAGLSATEGQEVLDELIRAALVGVDTSGRLAIHDLLRAYAPSARKRTRPRPGGSAARLLDHYLHTAHAAALRLGPLMESIEVPDPFPASDPRPSPASSRPPRGSGPSSRS